MHTQVSGRYRQLGLMFIILGFISLAVSAIFRALAIAGLGLGIFLIGILMAYLPLLPSIPTELVGEALMPGMYNLEGFLRSFELTTTATYLPPKDDAAPPRVFVPLSGGKSTLPELERVAPDGFLVTGQQGSMNGVLIEPPGGGLLAMLERESSQKLSKLPLDDLEDALRSGIVETLELASSVRLSFENSHVHFHLEGDVMWEINERLIRENPIVCERIGCPICSLAACVVAKASHRNVRLIEVKHSKSTHTAILELGGS